MKLIKILITLFFIFSLHLMSFAEGLGPFDLPPLGNIEVFREIPSFVFPTEQHDKKVLVNISTRCINTWTYNIESNSETHFTKDTTGDYPLERGTFILDMESYTVIPSVSIKVSEKLSVEAIVPIIHQTGGIFDHSIEKFHDMFGLGQNHRKDWEKNTIRYTYIEPDGQTTTYHNEQDLRGIFLGNITAGASYKTKNFLFPACLRLLVTFPTSETPVPIGKDSYNTTLQAIFSWEKQNIVGYHGIGLTHFSNSTSNGINLMKNRLAVLNTFEYKKSKTFSLIIHIVSASPVADYPMLDNPIIEMTLGFKKKIGTGILEVGFIENLFFFDNSPDVGVHIGYSIGFF